jgi:hypothetical protein
MWYLLKVDALIATFVFSGGAMLILALFAWQEAKAYAAARHRIYQRLTALMTEPQIFANSFANSRGFSRASQRGDASNRV